MDSQFNTLVSSYRDNYVQYKVTGNTKFQSAYESAQQGIQTILNSLENEVSNEKQEINDFYSKDIEGQLQKTNSKSKYLRTGIMDEHDLTKTAEIRQSQLSSPVTPGISTSEYTTLGVLVAIAGALMFV
jgi:type VII secretion effector (TIGR04197 family)